MTTIQTSHRVVSPPEIRDLLAAAIRAAGCVERFAALHGVTIDHVAKVLRQKRMPCAALSRALGLAMRTHYVKVESVSLGSESVPLTADPRPNGAGLREGALSGRRAFALASQCSDDAETEVQPRQAQPRAGREAAPAPGHCLRQSRGQAPSRPQGGIAVSAKSESTTP